MAQYYGYIQVPHESYDAWRSATINNSYDVDYPYGAMFQCWDYCALLWYQYGRRLVTKSGGGGAINCWTVSREANSKPPFVSIADLTKLKRGDIVVFQYMRGWVGTAGHIAILDENITTLMIARNRIKMLGQNQAGSSRVNVVEYPLSAAVGFFRNTNWNPITPPSPTPTVTNKRDSFPWAVAWRHWPNFKR